MQKPINVFYLYADTERDQSLFAELEKHLKTLEHTGKIATWHKGVLLPGQSIQQQTSIHFTQSQLILLLISSDFIASSSYLEEMMQALESQGQAEVVPILLRPTHYTNTPFAHLQLLPRDGRAITSSGKNIDEEFAKIASELDTLIQKKFMGTLKETIQEEKPVSEATITRILDALTHGIDLYFTDDSVKKDYVALYHLLDQKFSADPHATEALEEFVQEPKEWRGALKKSLKTFHADLEPEIIAATNHLLETRTTPATAKYVINNSGKIGTLMNGDHNHSTNTNNF